MLAKALFLALVLSANSYAAISIVGKDFEADASGKLTAVFVDIQIDNFGVYRIAVTDEEVQFNFNVSNDLTIATKAAIRQKLREKAIALKAHIIAKRQKEADERQATETRRGQIDFDPGDLN